MAATAALLARNQEEFAAIVVSGDGFSLISQTGSQNIQARHVHASKAMRRVRKSGCGTQCNSK
jgi:hypothetical protein